MIEKTAPTGFDLTEQFYFCSMPLKMDSYVNCAFDCTYCFAKGQMIQGHKGLAGRGVVPVDIKEFRNALIFAHDRYDKTLDIRRECLRKGMAIHWGGMSDPFMPAEEKRFRVSQKVMEILNWYQHPTCISTKSPLVTQEPYLSLLKQGKYVVQISTITYDDDFGRKVDYKAPSPSVRMRTIGKLADAGIPVVARIQPVIPGTICEDTLGEFIYRLSKLGVYHVSVEGLKLNSVSPINKIVPGLESNFDIQQGFERYMLPARKWRYIKTALEVCRLVGITCGVADNELRDLGTPNCCLGNLDWVGWSAQTGTAVQIARLKGSVTLQETLNAAFVPKGKYHLQDYNWTKDNDGIRRSKTIQECLAYSWRNDKSKGPSHLVCMTTNDNHTWKYRNPIPILEADEFEPVKMF